ncbi:MAG: ABC transporter ATP-binding protein [Actinobacteria bacterium]|nr:ABC transporter ATP-binding protein [Actinomycetota bacterium]
MVLTATGIVKRFGGETALGGVDLELGELEILGLIGPNGSGKTTLVNCLSGFFRFDAGVITHQGREVTKASRVRRARAGISRTFQTPRLFKELTVDENIAIGSNAAGRRTTAERDHVEALLARLGLFDMRREVVSQLPYGYQRRVEIARALASRPSVLLLDEPAAGLNDAETAELLELILEVRHEHNCAAVLIDHDMALVMKASDRVQVLDEGKVLFVGAPDDAFKQKDVVEAYLGSTA